MRGILTSRKKKKTNQDTENALFQGNIHLVHFAGETTSSAWNQPGSQAMLMQFTSCVVRLRYKLPQITIKYGLLYVVLCMFVTENGSGLLDMEPKYNPAHGSRRYYWNAVLCGSFIACWQMHKMIRLPRRELISFLGLQQGSMRNKTLKTNHWVLFTVSLIPLLGHSPEEANWEL